MNHKKLLKLIKDKEDHPHLTTKYIKDSKKLERYPKSELVRWYSSHKEHWIGWLEECDGSGYYNRKEYNRDARFIFNHVMNPFMLMWLCEVSGIDGKIIKLAIKNALSVSKAYPTQCSAIRKVINWEMIEGKLK